jgi:glucokinase
MEEHFGVKPSLQNDANACALAEWRFGAGKGCRNMIFMTFGTGLGAGLILGGRLYSGTNDNAGEVGHIRLDKFGPVGYGKSGSFEGFCSGGGIAQLGYIKALEKVQSGTYPAYFTKNMTSADITAKSIAEAADKGDETAIEVYRICGEYLGRGLSVLIDILNPQAIVLGSIFTRSKHLLLDSMKQAIEKEALPCSVGCCQILSAELGESIGDYAAIATALEE